MADEGAELLYDADDGAGNGGVAVAEDEGDEYEVGEPRLDHVVLLSGLPWTANRADVRGFLEGVAVEANGILFMLGGDALVAVGSDDDRRAALSRHRKQLAKRYVEVKGSSREEWERARQGEKRLQRTRGSDGGGGVVVELGWGGDGV